MTFSSTFYAFLKGEKSQSELDAYRQAMKHINDLEAALQAQVINRPLDPGTGPWSRPKHQQLAMAYTWVARALATIATTLLDSDAKEDPDTVGYLPLVTFGQVKELYAQVPQFVHMAWEALANPRFQPQRALPLPLGPRIEAHGKCPLVHLKGIHAAAVALDQVGQARLGMYLQSVQASGVTPPDDVKGYLSDLAQMWARAQSKVAFSTQQLMAVTMGGNVTLETHEEAENRLWDALADHFLVGQFIAMPELLSSATMAGANATGRLIPQEERWFMSDPDAVRDLRTTQFGEQEIREFWVRKAWRTTPTEERYLAQTNALKKEGHISVVSRWSTTPFDAVYQTLQPVVILDVPMGRGTEFHLNMDENHDELDVGTPRFRRTSGYQEDHEEGHVGDPSGHH
ncbi:MAG: hypothetical protein JWM10_950 [Myxococcaceae bacterium]|nr:hypothetical protein [Myxococcaceae bacterium]